MGKQILHKNLDRTEAIETLSAMIATGFKQTQIRTRTRNITVLVSKKGTVTVKSKSADNIRTKPLAHNRKKQYIIQEGDPVAFLIDQPVS